VNTIVYDPVWAELGFQEKLPVVWLKEAPAGSPVAEKLIVPPVFMETAVTVKLIQDSAATVSFPGTVIVGGINACTLTVLVALMLACGVAESVTVRSTVYDPGAEYV
jgi:hypothetical protein